MGTREVDESACGVRVGDETREDGLRERLIELTKGFALLQHFV